VHERREGAVVVLNLSGRGGEDVAQVPDLAERTG
jgi:tryptophan synthase beta subunit